MTIGSQSTKVSGSPWLRGIAGSAAKALIESDASVVRVIAGPGSGKTTCLKRRLQRLIQQREVEPDRAFAGTFTRVIAQGLREALGNEIRVSTLHSLAYEFLRKYPDACQGMRLRFLLRYEEDSLLYDIGSGAFTGNIYERREALRLLQASRAQREDFANAKFDGAVRRWLQRHRAMLIGEVVHLCVVGMECRDIPPAMFDHVVIDEYQDLTAAEQELVRLVWSGTGSLTVLGDNDQSIYGFRFNHPEGIADFHLSWPMCIDLTFTANWRSCDEILRVANLMMAEAGSTRPAMTSTREQRGFLVPVQWKDLEAEIEGLAAHVRAHAEKSFLILVPRRFIGYRLAEAIGPGASTAFAEQVLDHPVAQEAFATASLLADANDHVAARAYLGFKGAKAEQALRRNAGAYSSVSNEIGGHALIRGIASAAIAVSGPGQSHIVQRAKRAVELIERSRSSKEIIDECFCDSLASTEPDEEKQRWLLRDLAELRAAAQELLANQGSESLARVMGALRYRIATRAPLRESQSEEPRVRIMTLHGAKGLEADNVIIAGIADQLIPGFDEDDLIMAGEQRRLLYVAITRARDNLIISWPRRIQLTDVMQNMGRVSQVTTQRGVKWVTTSRSRLLPQSLGGVKSGTDLPEILPAMDSH